MTKAKQTPSQDYLNEIFEYKEGKLYWAKDKRGGAHKGDLAGCVSKAKGYRFVKLDGSLYREHRLIWKMFKGEDTVNDLDHINQDKADNRIENLRSVTRSINMLNNKAKGVRYDPDAGRFTAQIGINNKQVFIGSFDTEEEASSHYNEFKELYMEMKAC